MQKLSNMGMTSPNFEMPDSLKNLNNEPINILKETGTFSNLANNEKKSKYEHSRKTNNKSKKKSHSRCKSGVPKTFKRHNLNKSVLETAKSKIPTLVDDLGHISLSMKNKHSSGYESAIGVASPSRNIDKIIRDNLK